MARSAGIVAAALLLVVTPTAAAGAAPPGGTADELVPVIVQMRSPEDVTEVAEEQERRGGRVEQVYEHVLDGFAAELSPEAIAALERDPDVEAVTPDVVLTVGTAQPDAPWGLDRVDQRGAALDGTYSYDTTGAGVTAYVIDSGIRATHEDFEGRVRHGWDFVDGDADASDCLGHGTHVAGTVGGRTHGVAKDAQLVSLRVFGCGPSTTGSLVIAAIDWALDDRDGPAVINFSGGGSVYPPLDEAVARATASGVPVVLAAMNSSVDACGISPARAPSAITVGATSQSDARAPYSNHGPCVDLFAPGTRVLSTTMTSDTSTGHYSGTSMAAPHVAGAVARYLERRPEASVAEVTTALQLTATPDVVTDSRSEHDGLLHVAPPVTVIDEDFDDGAGDFSTTGGSWSATDGLYVLSDPASGTTHNSSIAVHDTGVTGDFTLTAAVGAAPSASRWDDASVVFGYQDPQNYWFASLNESNDGLTNGIFRVIDGTSTELADFPATTTPGSLHAVRVEHRGTTIEVYRSGTLLGTAQDTALTAGKVGFGSRNDPAFFDDLLVTGTRATSPPDAPGDVVAVAGVGSATVSWTPPAEDGGAPVILYTVTASPGGATAVVDGTTTTATVTGLADGTEYTFTVTATGPAGSSAPSAPSNPVTPYPTPAVEERFTDAGTADRFTTHGGTWTVSDGRYVLTEPAADTTHNSNLAVHRAVIGGDLTMSARAAAAPSSGRWDDLSLVFGYQDPQNYWFASLNESNDALTNGIFRVVDGTSTELADFDSTIVAGTSYAVTVERRGPTITVHRDGELLGTAEDTTPTAGRSGFGTRNDGAWFDDLVVHGVREPAPPSPPTGVVASTGDRGATVRWTAPADDGGAPITSYTVTADPGGATATVDGTQRVAGVDGLANGTTYTFTVTATNAAGTSAPSEPSAPVTPVSPRGPTLVDEDFSDPAAADGFSTTGGTWTVSDGAYRLTSPAAHTEHNANLAIHRTAVTDDFDLTVTGTAAPSASAWDDFSVVFGYQDPGSYYFVSLNESKDARTHGLFKVVDGVSTRLAGFPDDTTITPGTPYRVHVERSGPTLAVEVDGARVGSTEDTAFVAGRVGFGSRNDAAVFDDLVLNGPPAPPLVSEDFTDPAAAERFVTDGGTWAVADGSYLLTAPAADTTHNSNLAVHTSHVPGDFVLTATGAAAPTDSRWDDFSVVFGYQDPASYWFVSLNESNDGLTNGIFRVVDGVSTELADFPTTTPPGTPVPVRVERHGGSVTVHRGDTLLGTAEDPALTGGQVGLGTRNDAATFDDLTVTR